MIGQGLFDDVFYFQIETYLTVAQMVFKKVLSVEATSTSHHPYIGTET